MSHGGQRIGAGRKPGVGNKSSEQSRQKALSTGESPLDYMLKVMRDDTQPVDRRDEMARAAAPYVHARLQSTVLKGDKDEPIQVSWSAK